MPNEVIHELESIPLMPPLSQEEPKKQSKPPKLSLKVLNERIEDLRLENRLLVDRIEDLEKQLDAFIQVQIQVAAAAQWPVPCALPEPIIVVDTKIEESGPEPEPILHEEPQIMTKDVFVPRSVRHVTPKKKSSFWSFIFRGRRTGHGESYS